MKTRSGMEYKPFQPIHGAIRSEEFASLVKLATEKDNLEEFDDDDCEDGYEGETKAASAPPKDITAAQSNLVDWGDPPSADLVPPKGLDSDKKRRWMRRKRERLGGKATDPILRRRLVEASESEAIVTGLKTQGLPATRCGYQALHLPKTKGTPPPAVSLNKLLNEGYQYITWDGVCARPILDSSQKVIAVLAGRPQSDDYLAACGRIYASLRNEGRSANFSLKEKFHCRGHFPAINAGIIHGKGTKEPANLKLGHRSDLVWRLLQNTDMKRVLNFASSSLQIWNPDLHNYYKTYSNQLLAHPKYRSTLTPIHSRGVFMRITFNFGPNAWTFRHRDSLNLPFGWCAVQAFGDFDHTKGGHLVLEDLKLVIEFPPGSLILIPSATLTHANIPVCEGESRASITQFCSGGVFRFVDNGFKTEIDLKHEDPDAYQRVLERKKTRWQRGLGLYKTLDELLKAGDDQRRAVHF